jgi:hypothetical protein
LEDDDPTAPAPPEALYHYTTADFAQQVVDDLDAVGDVQAEIWEGSYGAGFYALDIDPDDASQDELRDECFQGARPDHPMDGVLVLDAALAEPPFGYEDDPGRHSHVWRSPGSPGSPQPIGQMIVEVRVYDGRAWNTIAEY